MPIDKTKVIHMTTNQITIQDLVSREVIYCVSSLIYTLNQEGKLDEEYWHLLESVDWDDAEAAINQNNCLVQEEEDSWGVYDKDLEEYIIAPAHDTKQEAIEEYFSDRNWDLHEYNREVYEHWLVSSWLAEKLKEQGETVEEFYSLTVWGRTTYGQAIHGDWVIQEIYNDLIKK